MADPGAGCHDPRLWRCARRGESWRRRRDRVAAAGPAAQPEVTILNWRREKSVFLGTSQPQEDASWIFQLRMAELERAKAGRTSEPRLWHRLGARLFDYALWGLLLALPLGIELNLLGGVIPEAAAAWLGHPLVAPILITASLDPGRSLARRPDADHAGQMALRGLPSSFRSATPMPPARPARPVLAGMEARGAGVVGGRGLRLSAARADLHRLRLRAGRAETGNRLGFRAGLPGHARTAGGSLNMATGIVGLIAMLWLYGVAWQHPMVSESIGRGRPGGASGCRDPGPAIPAERRARVAGDSIDVETGRRSPRLRRTTAPARGPPLAVQTPRRRCRRRFPHCAARPRPGSVVRHRGGGPGGQAAGRGSAHARRRKTGGAPPSCAGAWTDLELGSAEAWRCLGEARQARRAGGHREAVAALRKAKQYEIRTTRRSIVPSAEASKAS